MRHYGPIAKFDPHPLPLGVHPNVGVLDAAMNFDVSALEVFARGLETIEICPEWRGTLLNGSSDDDTVDLTSPSELTRHGGTPHLGSAGLDTIGYHVTQSWARHLRKAGAGGITYRSCRAIERAGIAVALYRPAERSVAAQHRLIDDALFPYLLATLDSVDVGLTGVDRCGRCSFRRQTKTGIRS